MCKGLPFLSFEAEKSKERIMLALSVIQGERSSS